MTARDPRSRQAQGAAYLRSPKLRRLARPALAVVVLGACGWFVRSLPLHRTLATLASAWDAGRRRAARPCRERGRGGAWSGIADCAIVAA
jgi:hypothetical protein